MFKRFFLLALMASFFINSSFAQDTNNTLGQVNIVSTGVPFLMIAPDARAGAMGDAGVSSSPDIYSMHWNPAKYAFIENDMGIGVSYSPWLKNLVPDLNLYSLNYYKRIDDRQTIAASLLYFSLGNITFVGEDPNVSLGTFRPNEFSFDLAYARKLSENFSASIAGRFIYSDLTQGQSIGVVETKAGISVAADISIYWRKEIRISRTNALFAFGLNISNIGSKISYTSDRKEFIPTNLRFGPSLMLEMDNYNTITFMFDVNKLLVPTPDGNAIPDDISVIGGIFKSFGDAPGGFSEEIKELQLSFGVEYWYDKQFALRAGYFYENALKGNRKFFTIGAGLKYNVFGLDFSYLIPTQQQHPLESTLRFSLLLDFEAFR